MQYFVGLPGYQYKPPFVPSLFVEIRRRMGAATFAHFHQAILNALETRVQRPDDQPQDPPHQGSHRQVLETDAESAADEDQDTAPAPQGKLILDATVAEQAIRHPTDLGLLNEAREISEQIIDVLYPLTKGDQKPRTYRQTARKAYLVIVKQRRPGARKVRKGIRQQLQYVLEAYPSFTGCGARTVDTVVSTVAAQVLDYPTTV